VGYITDSSGEGRNAIVVVDLGSGKAWRRLVNIPAVSPTQGFVPTVWGEPVYTNGTTGMPISNVNFGADGIAISSDGKTLWFSTTGGRQLYSVPTARLLDQSPYAELLAEGSVQYHGEKGLSDGLESDSNGLVYAGDIEANSIVTFDPKTGVVSQYTRDPRYSWTDTMSVGNDGYLYFTENQLWRSPGYQGGVDRRVKPYVLFRTPLVGNGTKIVQSAPSGAGNYSMRG
jgi:sugar lactone lactonase YvrE